MNGVLTIVVPKELDARGPGGRGVRRRVRGRGREREQWRRTKSLIVEAGAVGTSPRGGKGSRPPRRERRPHHRRPQRAPSRQAQDHRRLRSMPGDREDRGFGGGCEGWDGIGSSGEDGSWIVEAGAVGTSPRGGKGSRPTSRTASSLLTIVGSSLEKTERALKAGCWSSLPLISSSSSSAASSSSSSGPPGCNVWNWEEMWGDGSISGDLEDGGVRRWGGDGDGNGIGRSGEEGSDLGWAGRKQRRRGLASCFFYLLRDMPTL